MIASILKVNLEGKRPIIHALCAAKWYNYALWEIPETATFHPFYEPVQLLSDRFTHSSISCKRYENRITS